MKHILRFLGLPFVRGGRNYAGVDCWGLVRLFLQDHKGLYGLPLYEAVTDVETAIAEAMATPCWQQVENDDRREGDVVVMTTPVGGGSVAPLHVGVLVDEYHVLHIDEGAGSLCLRLTDRSIAPRLHSLWRHTELAGQA